MSETTYSVEALVNHKRLSDGSYYFLVKWLNFSDESNTWEPAEYLSHLQLYYVYLQIKNINQVKLFPQYWSDSELPSIACNIITIIMNQYQYKGAPVDAFRSHINPSEAKVYLINHKSHLFIVAHDPEECQSYVADAYNYCLNETVKENLELIVERNLSTCKLIFKDAPFVIDEPSFVAMIARKFKTRLDNKQPVGRDFVTALIRIQG